MEQNQKKWSVIRCPHCGWEYTLAEIFYPESLLGRPDSVIRDALGKIIYQDYTKDNEPCQSEKYFCDGCGQLFIVEPVLTFKTKSEVEELDFANDYVSLI